MPDDKLTVGAANRIAAMVPKKADVAAIGMGMSIAKPEALIALVTKLKDAGTKLLLDASALIPPVLKEIGNVGTVVTPHAGEYRRLFQTDAGKTADERAVNVQKMAQEHGVTVLLKGPVDVISDGKKVGLNSTHNPAMTVGGTGDVLSGITASLMAKMEPFNAALLAAYFNGLAGNLAYKKVGLHMTSDDLVEALPAAIKPFDRIVR
jgi:NAD(P)H-hydrate epimerase